MMKRVVLKEELAAVTGDFKLAMVLNQMMYWALRTRSAAAYRKETAAGEAAEHGWIYKSSEELAEEMMMNVSACSMRTYLKKLVGLGFLLERSNPHQKWDKTKQYRVQWKAVESAAAAAGWELEDSWKNWTVPEPPSFSSKEKNSGSKPEKPEAVSESIAETSTKSPSLLSDAYEMVFGKPGASVKKKLEDWASSSFFRTGKKSSRTHWKQRPCIRPDRLPMWKKCSAHGSTKAPGRWKR